MHTWLKREAPPLQKDWKPLAEFFHCTEEFIAYGETTSEKLESIVEETRRIAHSDQPSAQPETEADMLKRRGLIMFKQILAAAGDDPYKVAWALEQMLVHMRIPDHWITPASNASSNTVPSVPVARVSDRRETGSGHTLPGMVGHNYGVREQRKTG